MRILFITLLFIGESFTLFSQNADNILKEIGSMLTNKQYLEVIESLDKLKTEVEGLYLKQISADLLPAEIEGYKVKEQAGLQNTITGAIINIQKRYNKEGAQSNSQNNPPVLTIENEYITFRITNSPVEISTFLQNYTGDIFKTAESNIVQEKKYRYNGYRALHRNIAGERQNLLILIGGALVELELVSTEANRDIEKFARLLSIDRILNTFGK